MVQEAGAGPPDLNAGSKSPKRQIKIVQMRAFTGAWRETPLRIMAAWPVLTIAKSQKNQYLWHLIILYGV